MPDERTSNGKRREVRLTDPGPSVRGADGDHVSIDSHSSKHLPVGGSFQETRQYAGGKMPPSDEVLPPEGSSRGTRQGTEDRTPPSGGLRPSSSSMTRTSHEKHVTPVHNHPYYREAFSFESTRFCREGYRLDRREYAYCRRRATISSTARLADTNFQRSHGYRSHSVLSSFPGMRHSRTFLRPGARRGASPAHDRPPAYGPPM